MMLPGLLRNWFGEQEVKKHVQWSWPHKLKLITTELSVCDRQTILLTRCRNEEGKLCPRSNPFSCRRLWKSGWLQSFEEEKSKGNFKKKTGAAYLKICYIPFKTKTAPRQMDVYRLSARASLASTRHDVCACARMRLFMILGSSVFSSRGLELPHHLPCAPPPRHHLGMCASRLPGRTTWQRTKLFSDETWTPESLYLRALQS